MVEEKGGERPCWCVTADKIKADGFNLDIFNSRKPRVEEFTPQQLTASLLTKEQRIVELLNEIRKNIGAS